MIEFFQDFDQLHSGLMTKAQFERCLGALGLSSIGKHHLTRGQLSALTHFYECPTSMDKVVWTRFVHDMETG